MEQSLITSHDNKLFKLWASLQTAKGIERHGLALVSGRKIVPELLAERSGEGATLLLREGEEARQDVRAAHLARQLFDTLDEFGTGAPLLVLPKPEIATFDEAATSGLTIAIAAQDPANLGAILRSALAFDVSEAMLLKECAHPFLPRATRAASGANLRLRLSKGPSIQTVGETWIALDMQGEPIDTFDFPKNCGLLLGEEGVGVPASFAGRRVRIPIGAHAESLNVAVAAGIALAAYRRRHPL